VGSGVYRVGNSFHGRQIAYVKGNSWCRTCARLLMVF